MNDLQMALSLARPHRWGPLILLTTLGPLRPMKALLIALQYHHKAAEGQVELNRVHDDG